MPNGWTKWILGIGITIILTLVGGIASYQQVKIDKVKDKHVEDMVAHNREPHTTTARELGHLHEEVKRNGSKIDAAVIRQSELITNQAVQTEILKRIEGTVKEIKEKS